MTTAIDHSHSSQALNTVQEVQHPDVPQLQHADSAPPVLAQDVQPMEGGDAIQQQPALVPPPPIAYHNDTDAPVTYQHASNYGHFNIELQPGQQVTQAEMQNLTNAVNVACGKLAAFGQADVNSDSFRNNLLTHFRIDSQAQGAQAKIADACKQVREQLAQLNGHFANDLLFRQKEDRAEVADAVAYVKRNPLNLARDLIHTDPARPAIFEGPLHIDFSRLSSTNTVACTLIHEAAHRFLGARDWAYNVQSDMVAYHQAYTNLGMQVPASPASPNTITRWDRMTTAQALNNADSIAAFAMHANG